MNRLRIRFMSLTRDQKGATAVEYAMIVGLIAALAHASINTIGTNVKTLFNDIATATTKK